MYGEIVNADGHDMTQARVQRQRIKSRLIAVAEIALLTVSLSFAAPNLCVRARECGGLLQHIQLHRSVKPESKRGCLAS